MALRRVVVGLSVSLLASTALLAQGYVPTDQRTQQPGTVIPYVPQDQRAQAPQAFSPQDFRANRATIMQPQEQNTGWADHRQQAEVPVAAQQLDPRTYDPRTYDPRVSAPQDTRPQRVSTQPPPSYLPTERPQVQPHQPAPDPRNQRQGHTAARGSTHDPRTAQDYRSPTTRPQPGVVATSAAATADKLPVYEARPGVIDPRVIPAKEDRFIDYKPVDGRPYDFRPVDFKPVDTRALEYRSFDNKTQDQRVLDPRLKEKGPEIQARLECKAILYRSVECNFLDYKEVDPRLQELFSRYPELTLGIVPREYTKDTTDRWAGLVTHLSREIGLKVGLKIANDYQALIESQRAGLIHVAIYSPMAYARARNSGAKVEAFAIETNPDGTRGSHSMIYALARANAPKTEDFKGKSLGVVDPNSISGYSVPRFALSSQKVDPDSVLNKLVFTGSHENALVALSQGLVDYAVGQWTSDEDSTLSRLLSRNALKNVDGSPMRRDDFRVVMKSDTIMNAPIAYLSEMPEDLKAVIRRAFLEAPARDRADFDKIYDAKGRGWETVDPKAFDGTVDLVRYIDDNRLKPQTPPKTAQAPATPTVAPVVPPTSRR
ncbi:MAG: phosphate/phosphite/phosphonate ABC transporter substrate-binding protein [Proteobacteria bacterium]|nr:phosphate/phosphite/phosphonate ABC transporter substrate-binding protein [Pseudomonadota bacterium]